jgi:hypothetical protein
LHPGLQGRRPRRWVSKLHSRDLSEKWAALQTAVPCLHPSHKFQRVVDGPERAVVFSAGQQPGEGAAASTGPAPSAAVAATSSSGGGSSSGLDQFLATFPPSTSSCRDVAWIVVSHPEGPKQQQEQQQQQKQQQPASSSISSGSSEERIALAVEEWEQLVAAAAASGRRPTAADVDGLAVKHGILGGKWMLFARSGGEADAAWPVVARAVCGEAPHQQPLCRSAKISSAGPAEADGSWVLLVYTHNYTVGGVS